MALRQILKEGEPTLNKKSRIITKFDDRLHILIDDMRETLIDSGGVGLAAPQVGVLRRLVLVENDEGEIIELINPTILTSEGEQDGPEGCLSVPGVWGMVKRPMKVKVQAQDRNGDLFEVEGEGLTARAFCHETEHLDGHLFKEKVYKYLTEEELRNLSEEDMDEAGEDN